MEDNQLFESQALIAELRQLREDGQRLAGDMMRYRDEARRYRTRQST